MLKAVVGNNISKIVLIIDLYAKDQLVVHLKALHFIFDTQIGIGNSEGVNLHDPSSILNEFLFLKWWIVDMLY